MTIEKIRELIGKMTLEEKASLCSGEDFWHTKAIERLGIPAAMLTDGPHGLRKQDGRGDHLGLGDSIKAVCFPAGCATAASFDRELIEKMGETIGNECQAEGVAVILGPAVNIKRSPLCGRNFEYYSEDPLVASEMAGALIKGVQSKNVGTSIKHFLANNQEHRRMSSSSEVDERTLREIYLAAFEGAVKKQKPWSVMAAYNKINGVFAPENKTYLTDVLRSEWGFDGYVVSDWGAVNDRVLGLEAGLDLEMPSTKGVNDKLSVEAIKEGQLEEKYLDLACERMLDVLYRYIENRDPEAVFDREMDHEFAKKVAEECIVLLKNDGILPLKKSANIAFIGKYAKQPRYQGGGSSHINAAKITSAMDAVEHRNNILYAQGFDDKADVVDEVLLAEAVEAAGKAEVAVIFAGLPDAFECEGYDRSHMRLPGCQNTLIHAVCEVQENVVIVLHNGSPVEMPWIKKVKGVIECYLGGEAVGSAQVDILFGDVNPSGKLPESFPIKLQDNSSYLYFGGEGDIVEYREGVFVGYRYYDKKEIEVLFPFGHGLSYTEFEYSDLKLDKEQMKDTENLRVSVIVKNTGAMKGKEVVQLYVGCEGGSIIRPLKELRGFEKLELMPGESKEVTFTLDKRAFAYWNTTLHDWHVETGAYKIMVGRSSRDIVLEQEIQVDSTVKVPRVYSYASTIGDIMADPDKAGIISGLMSNMGGRREAAAEVPQQNDAISPEMVQAMMQGMSLRNILTFTGMPKEVFDNLIIELNK
ncbi:MAG TPA: glycosyl hydrolase [Clostridiales bacterium]|nr:glycosyl hydrolase [Clostridiales bacterium]